jgi:DNA polymerase-3 subunit epsilon
MSETKHILVIFDVETTGTRKDFDQIIELSAQQGLGDDAFRKTWRFKPSVPISPGAQRVHGISMDDLKDCAPFSTYAPKIRRVFEKADLVVGYNVSFDIGMLQAEFQRLRLPTIDLANKLIIDPFRLWQRMEPRTLQDAHRRFVGTEFDEAHSAIADIAATARVLKAMIETFNLTTAGWEEVANLCEPELKKWIGASHHVQWKNGIPVIAFGKHTGTPLNELAAGADAGYLDWILSKDFPERVKRLCDSAINRRGEDFVAWVEREFGPQPNESE